VAALDQETCNSNFMKNSDKTSGPELHKLFGEPRSPLTREQAIRQADDSVLVDESPQDVFALLDEVGLAAGRQTVSPPVRTENVISTSDATAYSINDVSACGNRFSASRRELAMSAAVNGNVGDRDIWRAYAGLRFRTKAAVTRR
jgi:hypothetical protein